MPVQSCKRRGSRGYRWGQSGKCFTGPRARAKAARQGHAIRASGFTGNRTEVVPSNPLKADPTRSITLRRIFVADFWNRFEALKGKILRLIVDEDAFGIKQTQNEEQDDGRRIRERDTKRTRGPNSAARANSRRSEQAARRTREANGDTQAILANAGRWEFRSDPEKVKAFEQWLAKETQDDIIAVTSAKRADGYWRKYVEQGYQKGQGRAFDDVKPAALASGKEQLAGFEATKGEFLRSSFGRPVAVNKVKLLAGRVFTDLKNVTGEMETQMSRILADGLTQGQNPRVIASAMNDRIAKIGQHRSTLIARTEITRAHAEGQLDAMEEMGVKEVGVMVEWSTAGDDRVCPLCQPMEGVVLTIKEARGIIPRHPQCRCAHIPANVGEPPGEKTRVNFTDPETGKVEVEHLPQQRGKGMLQGARDKSIKAEIPKGSKRTLARQKALTRWQGADTRFARIRPRSVLDAPPAPRAGVARAVGQLPSKAVRKIGPAAKPTIPTKKIKTPPNVLETKPIPEFPAGWVKQRVLKPSGTKYTRYLDPTGKAYPTLKKAKTGLRVAKTKALRRAKAKSSAGKTAAFRKAKAKADEAIKSFEVDAAAKKAAHEETVAGVKQWNKKFPATAKNLDAADYSDVPGWKPVPKGSSKTQSYGTILFDDEGRVLMRKPTGGFGNAEWTFAKGGGKLPGTTAITELAEETGHIGNIYDVVPGKFTGTTTRTNYFVGKSVTVNPALMDAETEAVKWMTFDEAMAGIAKSKDKIVIARDTKVLNAAFKTVRKSDGSELAKLVQSGKLNLADDANKAAVKAVQKKAAAKVAKLEKRLTDIKKAEDAAKAAVKKKELDDAGKKFLKPTKAQEQAAATKAKKAAEKAVEETAEDIKQAVKAEVAEAKRIAVKAQKAGELPEVAELTHVRQLPGSTHPSLMKNKFTGKQWAMKSPGEGLTAAHLESEALADEIYRVAGVRVPKSGIVRTAEGPNKLAEFLKGQELDEWLKTASKAEEVAMFKKIGDDFVMDALLANHDVAGLTMDNIFVVKRSGGLAAHRLDNGGALLFRAQGSPKANFGRVVQELTSMRDPSTNANTARIFGHLTDKDIDRQIKKLLPKRQAILDAIPDVDLRAKMAARLDYLEERIGGPVTPRTAPRVSGDWKARAKARRVEPGITDDTAKRIEHSRINGTTISSDRGDIEDVSVLAWEQETVSGQKVLKMQFKVTPQGSQRVMDKIGDSVQGLQSISGRGAIVHPEDVFWNDILAAAKTVNHHAEDGAYNVATLNKLNLVHKQVNRKLTLNPDAAKRAMLEHYQVQIDKVKKGLSNGKTVEKISQYEVPAAKAKPPTRRSFDARREQQRQKVARINNGRAREVDGEFNNLGGRSERFAIDVGDGAEVRFSQNLGSTSSTDGLAMQGTVELTMPGKATTARLKQAMAKLESIGLDMAPATAEYEELVYLHKSVYLRNDHNLTGYKTIWEATELSDAVKVRRIKKWAAKRYNVDFDNMQHYNPHGVTMDSFGNSHRYWERWDLPPDTIKKEMGDYVLNHSTYGRTEDALEGILQSGGELTPTIQRIRKGVSVSKTGGMSSVPDVNSGGASYTFTRIMKRGRNVDGFNFKIGRLARQDAVSYGSDQYGSIAKFKSRKSTVDEYREIARKPNNETIFKNGLSVLDDLESIQVGDAGTRERLIDVFKNHKITHLNDGRAVEDVVIIN